MFLQRSARRVGKGNKAAVSLHGSIFVSISKSISKSVPNHSTSRRCVSSQPRVHGVTTIPESAFLKSFATLDPNTLSGANPYEIKNLVNGEWVQSRKTTHIVDPMNGEKFLILPDTQKDELKPFIESSKKITKSGLHNPFKNPERYLMYGDVSAKAAQMLRDESVAHYFTRLIQRVAPKSYPQARAEVSINRMFFENFSGDQVRFMTKSFGVPGDHLGQMSHGFRWPYGPVALISPFNFPFEIPILQLMGALYMGNKVTFKTDSKVALVMEQAIRMLHVCGMPKTDVDMINSDGPPMHKFLLDAKPRVTQFTGSSKVAEILARDLHGKVKLEDAGFDWKILGPDVQDEDFVAYQCDQDAYAYSGQKCSAQSILFMHERWAHAGLLARLKTLASKRNLAELTVGPVLTVRNQTFLDHVKALLKIEGAYIAWGGGLLKDHSIPSCYGSFQPTAVFVPLEQMLKPENFPTVTTEIFGPFQIITEYKESQVDLVLEACERMENHLTAAIVSNDKQFQNKVLGHTLNGTTYCGIRARTTGAPQNHWFGPAGDPRGAGIGTPEAIKMVWSCHREIIRDENPLPKGWVAPKAT